MADFYPGRERARACESGVFRRYVNSDRSTASSHRRCHIYHSGDRRADRGANRCTNLCTNRDPGASWHTQAGCHQHPRRDGQAHHGVIAGRGALYR